MVRRAAVTRSIDEVDAITFLHVIVRPSGDCRRPRPCNAASAAAAVHEDDRKWMPHLRRRQVLHAHLAADDRAVWQLLCSAPTQK